MQILALPEFKSKEENRLSLCLFLYILTHHEMKRGGGILIGLRESYKEKPFLQMSFFFRSLSLSPLHPPPFCQPCFIASGLFIRFGLIYMTVLLFSSTLVWKMCVHAGWGPLCLSFAFSFSL